MKIAPVCLLVVPVGLGPGVFSAAAFADTAALKVSPGGDGSSLASLLNMPMEKLLEVKIAGPTRTLKSIGEVPASVTVFRHNELQKMGVDFLSELLNYVPGFQTGRDNDYGGTYFYSSRGSDTAQDTTAILLLIDGIPRQEIRNASASALSSLMPVSRIEQIEIIRGPGSALYGSGAFLGVINIVTVKDNNAVRARAGQLDSQALEGSLSAGSADWQVDVFASGYSDRGEKLLLDDKLGTTPVSTSDPQSSDNYAVRLAHRDTLFRLEHSNLQTEDYYSISSINNANNEQRHFMNLASLEQAINWRNLKSTLRLSYTENELSYYSQSGTPGQFFAVSNPASNDFLYGDVLYEVNNAMAQWLNDWYVNADNSVQFGMEQQHEQLDTARALTNFDTSMLANRIYPVTYSAAGDIYSEVVETDSRDIAGGYAQWQHRLNALTDITLGARYDNYQDLDSQTSIRLAMVRQLTNNDSLKLFYGEAFRAPSLNQVNVKETLTVASNPDLEAESIRTIELVWMRQQDAILFSASAFYNDIDNLIDSSGFLNGKRTNVNQEGGISNGVELESAIQWHPHWSMRAGYTAFLKLPDSAARESERLASLIVNYQRETWWANVSGFYNSERHMPVATDGKIDGFTIINAKLGYHLSNGVILDLQIKNLFDEDAASAPQSLAINTPIPYRGREISLGGTYQF